MPLLAKILIASLIGGLLSLFGGIALLARASWVRKFSLHFVSFAAGAILSAGLLDLLPEALEFAKLSGGDTTVVFVSVLAGILAFFILEQILYRFHPHHHEDAGAGEHNHATPQLLLIGDTIHNFIDGILIAVTFLANPSLGVLTTVAVAVHEIPQEIGDFSVMLTHGWSRRKVLWSNVVSSLASLLGAVLAFSAQNLLVPHLPALLALAAGIFIYIAVADLIPDLSHGIGRDKPSHVLAMLLLGIFTVGILGVYLR